MITSLTKTLSGKGFKVTVPVTLDEHFASNPIWVFKGKAAADKKAAAEFAWCDRAGVDEVVSVTAVPLAGHWVVCYWYDSATAAKRKARAEAPGARAADL